MHSIALFSYLRLGFISPLSRAVSLITLFNKFLIYSISDIYFAHLILVDYLNCYLTNTNKVFFSK
jgi:hypothetical protein